MNAKRQSKTALGHCGKTLLRLEITILKIYNPCNFFATKNAYAFSCGRSFVPYT